MTKYITFLISLIFTLGLTSCRDDFFGNMYEHEGDDIILDIDFMPVAGNDLKTRAGALWSFPGAGMSDIRDLCLVIFDEADKLEDIIDISDQSKYKYIETEENRTEADTSNGQPTTETTSKRRKYRLQLPTGKYYVYAVANLGTYTVDAITKSTYDALQEMDINTRDKFRKYRKVWQTDNFRNNSEMTGICTLGSLPGGSVYTGMEEKAIYLKPGISLHCWLRRLASKVTVDFDASNLDPSTTIYLKEIRVKDIAYDCSLIEQNTASANFDVEHGITNDNHGIRLCGNAYADEGKEEQFHTSWPYLTAGVPTLKDLVDSFDEYTPAAIAAQKETLENISHRNDAPCLFFYENMQGKDPNKPKHADIDNGGPDGIIDSPDSYLPTDPDYKDRMPAGTYVEVIAYYHSLAAGNEGEGNIIYRFMLGKDVIDDYNVERNYHFKLTLCFNGYANDVDWHIEYDRDKPPYSMPNEYYISYGYNEMMEFPITVSGTLKDDVITAEIIENDWGPTLMWGESRPSEGTEGANNYVVSYPRAQAVAHPDDSKKLSLGFLSLRKPQNDIIGSQKFLGTGNNEAQEYLWRVWRGDEIDSKDHPRVSGTDADIYQNTYYGINTYKGKRSLGYRVYTFDGLESKGTGDIVYGTETRPEYSDTEDGGYRLYTKKSASQVYPRQTTFYIPMYTRERNLCTKTGYTGENPYASYQRRAKVKFRFTVIDRKGKEYFCEKEVPIIQVAKLGNPMGIWRAWNNAAPFDVQLKYLAVDGVNFIDLTSHEGGWSAEVEQGADWILLNGARKKVTGNKDEKIHFSVRPIGILGNENQVRCGIITVRYHNFACIHKIFVRQGYAPLRLTEGDAAYHTFNLVTKNSEALNPCDEGSLFRSGNLDDPIDAVNNVNDSEPWALLKPNMYKDHKDTPLKIAGTNTTKTWNEISCPGTEKDLKWPESITVNGKTAYMMTIDDISHLWESQDGNTEKHRYQYGVLYSDKATKTNSTIYDSYRYKQADANTHSYGMRGCFVYNNTDGRQIFFPIGSSGYGKRKAERNTTQNPVEGSHGYKASIEIGTGVVRYSTARVTYMGPTGTAPSGRPEYQPLLWDIFRSDGANYWAQKLGEDSKGPTRTSLDLNYKTFDFSSLSTEPFAGKGSDALFIRLVDR